MQHKQGPGSFRKSCQRHHVGGGKIIWSLAHKEDFVPIYKLKTRLKDELHKLEKQELHRQEEDWFKKKLELEMVLEKKVKQEMAKPQVVKLQAGVTMTLLRGSCSFILTPREVPSRVGSVVHEGSPFHGNHRSGPGRGRQYRLRP